MSLKRNVESNWPGIIPWRNMCWRFEWIYKKGWKNEHLEKINTIIKSYNCSGDVARWIYKRGRDLKQANKVFRSCNRRRTYRLPQVIVAIMIMIRNITRIITMKTITIGDRHACRHLRETIAHITHILRLFLEYGKYHIFKNEENLRNLGRLRRISCLFNI